MPVQTDRSGTKPAAVVFDEQAEQGSDTPQALLEIAEGVAPRWPELFELLESTPAMMSRGELLVHLVRRMPEHIDMLLELTKRVHMPVGLSDQTGVKGPERRHAFLHA